jgi:hypothetical protein
MKSRGDDKKLNRGNNSTTGGYIMSKSLVFKKVANGETNYWLSLRDVIGTHMPNDITDILVRVFVTKKENAWTKKLVEKEVQNFINKNKFPEGKFEIPMGEVKIVLKNGKIIDLHDRNIRKH